MTTPAEPTVVRQHERLRCQLAALIAVASEHADRIVFAPSVTHNGRPGSSLAAEVIDASPGGMGIRSKVFIPKQARLTISLEAPPDALHAEPLRYEATVQRVRMLDRAPTYYLGASFTPALSPEQVERLLTIVRRAAGQGSLHASTPPGATHA